MIIACSLMGESQPLSFTYMGFNQNNHRHLVVSKGMGEGECAGTFPMKGKGNMVLKRGPYLRVVGQYEVDSKVCFVVCMLLVLDQ